MVLILNFIFFEWNDNNHHHEVSSPIDVAFIQHCKILILTCHRLVLDKWRLLKEIYSFRFFHFLNSTSTCLKLILHFNKIVFDLKYFYSEVSVHLSRSEWTIDLSEIFYIGKEISSLYFWQLKSTSYHIIDWSIISHYIIWYHMRRMYGWDSVRNLIFCGSSDMAEYWVWDF